MPSSSAASYAGSRGSRSANVDALPGVEIGDDAARERERMRVVRRVVVGDAGLARMHVGAAEILGRHHLAGRRLHQRRPAEKDRALALRTMMVSSDIAGT